MNKLQALSSALLLSGSLSASAPAAAPSQPSTEQQDISNLALCLRNQLGFHRNEPFRATYVDFQKKTKIRLDFQQGGVVGAFSLGQVNSADRLDFISADAGSDGHLDTINRASIVPENVVLVYKAWVGEMLESCERLPATASHTFYNATPLPPNLRASLVGIVDSEGDFFCSGHAVTNSVINTANHCVDPSNPDSRVVWPARYSDAGHPTAVYQTSYHVIPDAEAKKSDLAHLVIPVSSHNPAPTPRASDSTNGKFYGFILGRPFSVVPLDSHLMGKGSSGGLIFFDHQALVFSQTNYFTDLTLQNLASISAPYSGPGIAMPSESSLQICPIIAGEAFGWTNEGRVLLNERVDMKACVPVEQ